MVIRPLHRCNRHHSLKMWTQSQARRIVVFVVGGVTRSEIRVAHKLSARLGRDIILGGTSADIPSTFVKGLAVSLPLDHHLLAQDCCHT